MNFNEAGYNRGNGHTNGEHDHWVRLCQSAHERCPAQNHPCEEGAKAEGRSWPLHIEDSSIARHVEHIDPAHAKPANQEDDREGNIFSLL